MMIIVDVYIWRQKGSSVGHAMMTETCSKTVLLSQFPHKPGGVRRLMDRMYSLLVTKHIVPKHDKPTTFLS
jgi:hypothetical protein